MSKLKIGHEGLKKLFGNDDFNLETNDNTYNTIAVLTPKHIWLKARKEEILDVIERYAKAKVVIPSEWIEELRELERKGV